MMTVQETDHKRIRFYPPVPYLACLVVGFIAEHFLPTQLFNPGLAELFGYAFPTLGGVMIFYAVKEFTDVGTSFFHFRPTTKLVQTGIYHLSRNPIYVGLTFIYTGVGVGMNNLWILALLVVILPLMNWGVVKPEEIFLEEKFGEIYRRYKYQVRRWL